MDLVMVGADAEGAARAMTAAKAEIRRLDAVLSGWRPDSELARLNTAEGPLHVSHDLYQVIARCEAFRTASGGAFSARLGAAEAAWRDAEHDGALPSSALLIEAADRAEGAQVRLDPADRTIDRDGATFAVDALAKGYVIDRALEAAYRAAPGAQGLMLDIGGDLRCLGSGPQGDGWRIGVARGAEADNRAPALSLRIGDRAVATSGPGARDRTIDGRRVGHTLVPATGEAAPARTVTVVAKRAADADALATALSVQPVHAGLALAARHGAEARILEADGRESATEGWSALLAPALYRSGAGTPQLVRAAAANPWPAGFEVGIDYEIQQVPAGRYHSPFVAIWITDQNGRLVRTLFHLGNHPQRFLDSNYVWWRDFNADNRGVEKLAGVTRPSRQPGRYSATWDGKDDAGNPVGQGRYVINIEMTREHGGHSLQTMTLDLGRAPVQGQAQGEGESGPAAARYGRPSI